MSGKNRKSRVEHALREELTNLIQSGVKDPRVQAASLLTVTKVELNVDLSIARCYVSIVAEPRVVDGVIKGLTNAAGFLRGPLARACNLARPPELRFFHDQSVDMNEKLAKILREDEEKASAVGRKPGEAEPEPSGRGTGTGTGEP